MEKALIRLFKAVGVNSKERKNNADLSAVLSECIEYGFILLPEVIYNYSYKDLSKLILMISKEIGLSSKQMNASFHKSWNKVKKADIKELVIEQIIHYITTYGFEALGIYNSDSIYIPAEKLEIPELKDDINLIVVKSLTRKEIKEKVMAILKSGIALKEDTISDIMTILNDLNNTKDISSEDINEIKNKEIMVILCEKLEMVPSNPVELLRYLVYKTTNKTLLIKSKEAINLMKAGASLITEDIKRQIDYNNFKLASIFYRFKPLFLALKSNKDLKPTINRIRKLAYKYHKPMEEDYLNNITAYIKNDIKINEDDLKRALDKANIFRKIRLSYTLSYRTREVDTILYRIRNGKGYADDFSFKNKIQARIIRNVVLGSIIENIKKNVEGKKIYIQNNVKYALPATEKQFSGNIPSGTSITVPKNMIVGVNWNNVGSERIDLDLAMRDVTHGKLGWDGLYRSDDAGILFSGDITDASGPDGATELFYIAKQKKQEFLITLNHYNRGYDRGDNRGLVGVPFKILVASEEAKDLNKNYMVDPNNVVATIPTSINDFQKILGLLITTTKECRFYITETNIGMTRSSGRSKNDYEEKSRKYLIDFYKNIIDLNKLFMRAGGILIDNKENADIDLSLENIDKAKIIELLM